MMKKLILIPLVFIACNFEIDHFEKGKERLLSGALQKAKNNFEQIQDTHPKKDSADYFIRIVDSLLKVETQLAEAHYNDSIIKQTISAIELIKTRKKEGAPKNLEGILLDVELMKLWSLNYWRIKKIEDEKAKKHAITFKKEISTYQRGRLPQLRKNYALALGQKLWENDLYVRSGNSLSTTLNISGGIFAANKNIKDFQTEMQKQFKSLRFKQVRYRWYKEADEYSYYPLDPPKDSELY